MSLVFLRDLMFNLNPPGGFNWLINLPVTSVHIPTAIYAKSNVD